MCHRPIDLMARACKISERKKRAAVMPTQKSLKRQKRTIVIRLSIRVPIVTRIAFVALSNCLARACSEAVPDQFFYFLFFFKSKFLIFLDGGSGCGTSRFHNGIVDGQDGGSIKLHVLQGWGVGRGVVGGGGIM